MCPGNDPAHTVLQLVACCSNSPQAVELSADAWNTVRQEVRPGGATASAGAGAALWVCNTSNRVAVDSVAERM
jgi:hypothetical protein